MDGGGGMRRLVVAVAVLTAAVPLPVAARPGPAPADARAEWVRQYRAHARGLPVAPLLDAAASPVPDPDFSVFLPAGDLDGDGAGDVGDVRITHAYDEATGATDTTISVEARRGRDGHLLWSRTIGGNGLYPYVFFAPVGTAARPGMVAVTRTADVSGPDEAYTVSGTTTVAAFDGRGTPLWTYDSSHRATSTLGTWVYEDAEIVGTGDLAAGRAVDLLVEGPLRVHASDPLGFERVTATRIQLRVLDGATGTVRALGQPIVAGDAQLWPTVVGDVDGDRLDDVAYLDPEAAEPSLRVLRSSDGGEHSAVPLPEGEDHYVTRAPDLTGDGRADVLVDTTYDDEYAKPRTTTLVDAARGRAGWTRFSAYHAFVGDVDGRPGTDLVEYYPIYVPGGLGVRLTAINAAGSALWTVTRTLRDTGPPDRSREWVLPAGDVNGDGVTDLRYSMATGPGTPPRREDGLVDGRTGRVRAGQPAGLFAAGAALDGRGEDAFTQSLNGDVLTLTAWRGDGSGRLWATSLRASGSHVMTFGARLDGDRCAELAVTTRGTRATTYVLSGATGAPLWTLTRPADDGPGVVSRSRAISTRRFVRTC